MALPATDRVMKARISLLADNPFFGYLLVRFKYLMLASDNPEDKCPCKTMSVDAKGNIRFYDKFVAELTDRQLMAVLCHEVLHVALEHILRAPRRVRTEPRLGLVWNYSIDLVANAMLLEEGFELPAKTASVGEFIVPTRDTSYGQKDKGWEYTFKNFGVHIDKILSRSAEEVFHVLLRALPPDISNGPAGFDVHEMGDSLGEDQKDEIGREWSGRVAEAAASARSKGKLPGSLAGLLGKVAESKVNWRARLWQFVQSHAISGFSWARPSRKAIAAGVYLPVPYRENLEVVLSADSSGSISQTCLGAQIGEAQAIVKCMSNVKATMIVCDAQVQEVFDLDKFNLDEWLASKHNWGRGGTSHRPVVDWINENKPDARLYVCMTDGYSDIESCFKELSPSLHKLILLAGEHVPEGNLSAHADTILVEED